MTRAQASLPSVAVADQINATTQPIPVQPSKGFVSKIASDWWCLRYFAKPNGRKYRAKAASARIRLSIWASTAEKSAPEHTA